MTNEQIEAIKQLFPKIEGAPVEDGDYFLRPKPHNLDADPFIDWFGCCSGYHFDNYADDFDIFGPINTDLLSEVLTNGN